MSSRPLYKVIAISIFAVLSVLAGISCGPHEGTTTSPQRQQVRLIQEWTPNSNYAGAIVAKHHFAASNGIDLKIRPGTEQVDAVAEVLAGRADFGDASADKVLMVNARGGGLVVIGTVSQYSPTCFLTKQGSGISSPRDFEGKRVGILPGTNTEKIYRMLLAKSGLPSPLPNEVIAPFDLTSFIQGQYDVRPAFIYDEPVTLRQKGIEFTIINPLDYGVKFVGTVYFCTAETILNKESMVQAFVNSVCDGWRLATRRPEEAIRLLKDDWPEIDKARELASLAEGLPSFTRKDGQIIRSVESDWRQMIADLVSLGGETSDLEKVDLSKVLNNSFVDKYYARVEK